MEEAKKSRIDLLKQRDADGLHYEVLIVPNGETPVYGKEA